ncbi:MAG: tRNA lysidine(34) synthetase TilS [Anaerolineales bacterium]|nr:tRNA lysidine(34) synthetase TilS [Anaerolineales bacterium]
MLENFESILRDECKLGKDRPVIVGVSGGPDSLCLMEAMRQAGYKVIIAHFNHQLRPEASEDARVVEKTAARLMLGSIIDGADVRAYAEEEKLSIEEAARNLRYRFMFNLAREHDAQAVAVGHTADDQVETVLMHFLRGSGLAGLKGMTHRGIVEIFDAEIPIVRPLLNYWREETVVFCAANGLRPHYDSTNDSLNFQRNRIRHLLLPTLESYNPKFREAVQRMSQSLKSDHDFLNEAMESFWNDCLVELGEEEIVFDHMQFSRCSLGLQRNMLKRAMLHLRPGLDVTFSVLERATTLINDELSPPRVNLKGGLRMFRENKRIYVCTPDAALPFNLWPQILSGNEFPVQVPGQVELSAGWRFNSERWHIPALALEQAERNEDQFQVWLDADTLPESLDLRVRKSGDQFEPLGLEGHMQKISDFMVNEKMPQRAREHWPLLSSGDTIVWVPGYRPAHSFRLTEATRNVVYFSITRPPERLD